MRIAALIFGLLGAVGSGFLGYKWTSDMSARKNEIDLTRKLVEASNDPAAKAKLAELDGIIYAAYALLGGAALGAVACVLVLNRKGMIAALLFLVAFATPLVLAKDGKAAVFTFGLALGALFSFLVKSPTPYKAPARRPGLTRDDDLV